jgi:hypothetical protein
MAGRLLLKNGGFLLFDGCFWSAVNTGVHIANF